MIKIVLLTLLLMLPMAAQAKTTVYVNGLSYHTDSVLKNNSVNLGAGFGKTLPFSKYQEIEVGFYENSHYKNSLYAKWNNHLWSNYNSTYRLGTTVGAAYYPDDEHGDRKIKPIVGVWGDVCFDGGTFCLRTTGSWKLLMLQAKFELD